MTTKLIPRIAAVLLIAGTIPAGAAESPASAAAEPVPAGRYTLDRAHASLIFRVDHLGFSMFTARFKRFDATLDFDPQHPTASRLTATVDAASLETDFPDPDTLDFNAMLEGKEWLDTKRFPEMKYQSRAVEVTGPGTMRVIGDLTLHGVTVPVPLDVRFNGGYAGHPMDPNARIGFSAHGSLDRSAFGIASGIPAPGTKMGVSDAVDVIIEAEFSGPAWQGASGDSATR